MAPLTKPMEGLDPRRLWPANNKYHQLPSKTHASPRQTEGKTKGLCRVCVGFPWGFGRPHNVPIRSLQEDTISHCKTWLPTPKQASRRVTALDTKRDQKQAQQAATLVKGNPWRRPFFGLLGCHRIGPTVVNWKYPLVMSTVCYWTWPFIVDLHTKNGDFQQLC